MIELWILDENRNRITLIDTYSSLIWANRYDTHGDCELMIEASFTNLAMLKKASFLARDDDEMVCRIEDIKLNTDTEDGDYLIIVGIDIKKILQQRIVWTQTNYDGLVEEYVRQLVTDNLINPQSFNRKIDNFKLDDIVGFEETVTEQTTYSNLDEKIQEICKKHNWGYKVRIDNNDFKFSLYKGEDKSNYIIFSDNFENLASTKYEEDNRNLANVALVAGSGEGADRSINVTGSSLGMKRYEIYVDARDISKIVNYDELKSAYPGGIEVTINNITYYQVNGTNIAIINRTNDIEEVTLVDSIYNQLLSARGEEKLAEFGSVTKFEGNVSISTTFEYKKDYNLGDIVTIENSYGISLEARITEIIEVVDSGGYSIEPTFEYIVEEDKPIEDSGYLLTEEKEKIITEDGKYIMIESLETLTNIDNQIIKVSQELENKKISELNEAININFDDVFPIVNNFETKKVKYSTLENKIKNNLDIPKKTSDLTNDSGFIKLSDVPEQVNSDWNAASGKAEILNKPSIPSIEGLEHISNKVSVSSTATSDQYANAKSVYDYGQELIALIPAGGLKIPISLDLESQLPTTGQKNGDYYFIQNMNITAPGHTGRAWWNSLESTTSFLKVYDQYNSMDGVSIIQTGSGEWQVSTEWLLTNLGLATKTYVNSQVSNLQKQINDAVNVLENAIDEKMDNIPVLLNEAHLNEIESGLYKLSTDTDHYAFDLYYGVGSIGPGPMVELVGDGHLYFNRWDVQGRGDNQWVWFSLENGAQADDGIYYDTVLTYGYLDYSNYAYVFKTPISRIMNVWQYEKNTNKTDTVTSAASSDKYTSEKAVWDAIQSGGNGPSIHYIIGNTTSTPFVFENYESGIYVFQSSDTTFNSTVYFKALNNNTTTLGLTGATANAPLILILLRTPNGSTSNNTKLAIALNWAAGTQGYIYKSTTTAGMSFTIGANLLTDNTAQSISAQKTFNVLPIAGTEIMPLKPTQDNQFVIRGYLADNQKIDMPVGTIFWDLNNFLNEVLLSNNYGGIWEKWRSLPYNDEWQSYSWYNPSYINTSQSSYTLNEWKVVNGILYIACGVGATATINTTTETEIARIPITGNTSFNNSSRRIWTAGVGGSGAMCGFMIMQQANYISVYMKPHTSAAQLAAPWYSCFFAIPLDSSAIVNLNEEVMWVKTSN